MDLTQQYPNEEYPAERKEKVITNYWTCPKCNQDVSKEFKVCPSCVPFYNTVKDPLSYQPITTEALELVNGDRRQTYGDVKKSFQRIASEWSTELGIVVTPMQVARMMIRFKLCREMNKHKRDNLVDICGYSELLNMLYE